MIFALNVGKRRLRMVDFEKAKIDPKSFNTVLRDLDHSLEMSEDDFKKLKNSSYDLDTEKEGYKEDLKVAYRNIMDLLQKYCDLDEIHYPIIATWIIGTYFHDQFYSYPYLFLNAMRGSGKSRTLKLITNLSYKGQVQMSMTEAVLFRTNGTLGIDEFEGLSRRGNENLRELLNASYKKGTKVKRMKQKKTMEGVEQVVEEFDVYRPIVMANIWGMEEVLGDRCISLVIEKSNNKKITSLVEIWEWDKIFIETKKILENVVVYRNVVNVVSPRVYREWNKYVTSIYITTQTTQTTYNNKNYTKLFKSLNSMQLDGRTFELVMPLLIISWKIGETTYTQLHNCIKNYIAERQEDQFVESKDIMFIDYISQEPEEGFIMVKKVTQNFKEFLQSDEEWITPKWVGQALKRLKLRKANKREAGGIKVLLDIKKAQERIKMFK
jgi:hypothetical protein